MLKLLKYLTHGFLAILIIYLFLLNVRLYKKANCETLNEDLYQQLIFLEGTLDQGADKQMQQLYPEGFLFFNALYSLSWANLLKTLPPEDPIFQKGIQEIDRALQAMNTEEARSIFSEQLSLIHGVFYTGWTNYVLAQKLMLLPPAQRDSADILTYQNTCKLIAETYHPLYTPYLTSYKYSAWPADNMVCMASLAHYSTIFSDSSYQPVLETWMEKVKKRLDERYGLIPHSVHYLTGRSIENPRGSSQSLMLIFLQDIDPVFAQQQFEIYKDQFVDYRFWLPGIREYPKNISGYGDIDSGPVILGIGGSASIVGIPVMAIYGEQAIYEGLRNSVEAFGMPISGKKGKRYLLGKLPIADAFIAWANSWNCLIEPQSVSGNWRLGFHLLSLCLIFIIGLVIKSI